MDKFEEMAREYIEGSGGLFDLYHYEMAIPVCAPPEVEGARYGLICLIQPQNRSDLDALIAQSDIRIREQIKLGERDD